MNENELYHYGVLGMKWGHRKNQGIISTSKMPLKKGTMIDGYKKYKLPGRVIDDGIQKPRTIDSRINDSIRQRMQNVNKNKSRALAKKRF